MITLCTQHGKSTRKARCSLSKTAREAFRDYAKQHPDRREGLIMCCVAKEDPAHGAACATDASKYTTAEEHEVDVMRCLKSSVRSAKIRRTKALKKTAAR